MKKVILLMLLYLVSFQGSLQAQSQKLVLSTLGKNEKVENWRNKINSNFSKLRDSVNSLFEDSFDVLTVNSVRLPDGSILTTTKQLSDSVHILRIELDNLRASVLALYDSLQNGGSAGDPPVSGIPTANYYVSPSGNDNNAGTYAAPFATIQKAYSVVTAGQLVYVRGGTYNISSASEDAMTWSGRNGTSGNLIKFWAYPGETPVINFSGMTNTSNRNRGLVFSCNYWYWKGIDFVGVPHFSGQNMCTIVYTENSSNSIWEQCRFHDGNAAGLVIRFGTGNLILNCDFYMLGSSDAGAGDPNGLMVVSDYGTTNTVRGCRAWWCSDDGFDMFGGNGVVNFENCWSFWNGYVPGTFTKAGDGMGFKLGNSNDQVRTTILRTLTNCLAFENVAHGFDQNFDSDATTHFPIALYNCTSYKNGVGNSGYGFRFGKFNDANILRNNISYANPYTNYVNVNTTHDHNSWDTAVTVTDSDFQSLNSAVMTATRQSDGSLPIITFMKLATSSDLINAGADLGYGKNIGAF